MIGNKKQAVVTLCKHIPRRGATELQERYTRHAGSNDNRTKQIGKPGSVPFHTARTVMIIPLGHTLPHASSDRTQRHRASNSYPTFSHLGDKRIASLFGLAPSGVYQALSVATGTGALLPHRFTLTEHWPGGLFSVALSLGSPPLDVIQHPALWSPDFPLSAVRQRAII